MILESCSHLIMRNAAITRAYLCTCYIDMGIASLRNIFPIMRGRSVQG